MINRIATIASAGILAASMLAAPVFADGHGELVEEVTAGLNMIGVQVGDTEITEEQATQLKLILNGGSDDVEKKMAAEKVLGM